MDLIKEIEMIKMRKDINYLQDKYGFTDSSLAKISGLAIRTIREFMDCMKMMIEMKYYFISQKDYMNKRFM